MLDAMTGGIDSLLITIVIVDDTSHNSTKVKITPTLTASQVCKTIAEKIGIQSEDFNFFTLIVVFTTMGKLESRHYLRTLKSSDLLLNILRDKEQRTPATSEHLYTTKW